MFAGKSFGSQLASFCDTKVDTEHLLSLPFWGPEPVLDSLGEIKDQSKESIQLPPEGLEFANPTLGQRTRAPLQVGLVAFLRKWVGSSD